MIVPTKFVVGRVAPTSAFDLGNHIDYWKILALVAADSTVLDLGCGSGELLALLSRRKNTIGRGVEIDEPSVIACIAKGISVFQGDLDEGLKDYPSQSYDYVILNRTLQMVHNPILLLNEMLRVGRNVIVNFPNFGHINNRLQLLFRGRMPVTRELPYQWYDTPNIHFCTRRDFVELCNEHRVPITAEVALGRNGVVRFAKNLRAKQVCFVLRAGV